MTGPPYPPPPGAGSNAIGQFVIGVSPIGDIAPFNVWNTVESQYANSPILTQLILNFDSYLDQTASYEALFDNVWNVLSGQPTTYGLDVWGRIVGVQRNVQVASGSWFGFAEASPGSQTFGHGPFYSGSALTTAYRLEDLAFYQLILAKAQSNISNGSIESINSILRFLFPNQGNAYATEGQIVQPYFGFAESTTAAGFNQAPFYAGETLTRMTMTYTFNFPLTPVQLAIAQTSGVLPKSTGVKASVVVNI